MTWDGYGQPGPDESWSGYALTFSGNDTCAPDLLGYGAGGEYGRGPAPEYDGPSANLTGVAPVLASS